MPKSEELALVLRNLRLTRRDLKRLRQGKIARRKKLTAAQRSAVLQKAGGRCHICGGAIAGPWQADHVRPHSEGGEHAVDNYLPAHALCNNYRWDYSADEFQFVLKLGVWIRGHIERRTQLGVQAAKGFAAYEAKRQARRRAIS